MVQDPSPGGDQKQVHYKFTPGYPGVIPERATSKAGADYDRVRVEDFKYRQVAAAVKWTIESGELRPGDAVPSARQLAQEHGVSVEVCRKALRLLVADGTIVRVSAGLPFYVAE